MTSFVASVVFVTNPAQSAIFNVNGTNYDIITVIGTYNDLQTQLQATPWYKIGDNRLANAFVQITLSSLGLPNISNDQSISGYNGLVLVPYFAWDGNPNGWNMGVGVVSFVDPGSVGGFLIKNDSVGAWAVASAAVPEPLTILGAVTAAGFGVGFKRKLAKSKKDEKDA